VPGARAPVADSNVMLHLATDWSTISALATGAGTLVLAVATFAAVRSSNRSARIAESALQEQRRPIFTQSRLDDPVQKIMFVDRHWVVASGGHGVAEHDGHIYFAMSLRNVGAGIGVCQAWHVTSRSDRFAGDHTPEEEFRLQTRDLYIPSGDIGMWQGALRDRNDPTYQAVAEAIDSQEPITVELLYSDQVGNQRTISRFALFPYQAESGRVEWFATINRHWYLDRAGPRSEEQVAAAVDVVIQEREAAAELARAEAMASENEAAESEATSDGAEPLEADLTTTDQPHQGDRSERPEPISAIVRPNCE
jgi:hypothetical protein